jgi:hypothetical protein
VASIGDLDPSLSSSFPFRFSVDPFCPKRHTASFSFHIRDHIGTTWDDPRPHIPVNVPSISIVSLTLDDRPELGNGDFLLAPSETAILHLIMRNNPMLP